MDIGITVDVGSHLSHVVTLAGFLIDRYNHKNGHRYKHRHKHRLKININIAEAKTET